MIGYMISSILWAVGGLVVGFFLGRSGQTFPTVKRNGSPKMSERPEGSVVVEATVHRFRDSWTFDRVVGWVILVMAVASMSAAFFAVNRQQQQVNCQADYNVAFVAALKERSEAATADRQAQRELLTGTFSNRDPEIGRALVEAYLRRLDTADNQRDDNPLPERPTC